MGTYLFILKDKQPSVLTKQIYYAHIDHLKTIKHDGHLYVAGPLKDQDKIMQIIIADSITEAEDLVKSDPYISSKYYLTYEGYEWLEANENNNWLMDTPRIIALLKTLEEG